MSDVRQMRLEKQKQKIEQQRKQKHAQQVQTIQATDVEGRPRSGRRSAGKDERSPLMETLSKDDSVNHVYDNPQAYSLSNPDGLTSRVLFLQVNPDPDHTNNCSKDYVGSSDEEEPPATDRIPQQQKKKDVSGAGDCAVEQNSGKKQSAAAVVNSAKFKGPRRQDTEEISDTEELDSKPRVFGSMMNDVEDNDDNDIDVIGSQNESSGAPQQVPSGAIASSSRFVMKGGGNGKQVRIKETSKDPNESPVMTHSSQESLEEHDLEEPKKNKTKEVLRKMRTPMDVPLRLDADNETADGISIFKTDSGSKSSQRLDERSKKNDSDYAEKTSAHKKKSKHSKHQKHVQSDSDGQMDEVDTKDDPKRRSKKKRSKRESNSPSHGEEGDSKVHLSNVVTPLTSFNSSINAFSKNSDLLSSSRLTATHNVFLPCSNHTANSNFSHKCHTNSSENDDREVCSDFHSNNNNDITQNMSNTFPNKKSNTQRNLKRLSRSHSVVESNLSNTETIKLSENNKNQFNKSKRNKPSSAPIKRLCSPASLKSELSKHNDIASMFVTSNSTSEETKETKVSSVLNETARQNKGRVLRGSINILPLLRSFGLRKKSEVPTALQKLLKAKGRHDKLAAKPNLERASSSSSSCPVVSSSSSNLTKSETSSIASSSEEVRLFKTKRANNINSKERLRHASKFDDNKAQHLDKKSSRKTMHNRHVSPSKSSDNNFTIKISRNKPTRKISINESRSESSTTLSNEKTQSDVPENSENDDLTIPNESGDRTHTVDSGMKRCSKSMNNFKGGQNKDVDRTAPASRLVTLVPDPTEDLEAFVFRPAPQGLTIKCHISRDNHGVDRSVYPTYYLHMERDDGRRVFLLAARRRKRSATSNYLISCDATELTRDGDSFAGKLRANFLGTQFTVYDNGVNPKKGVKVEERREMAAVVYASQVICF